MTKIKRIYRTRALILDAAEEVVARDGVLNLTFDRVAAEAGVSKGTVLYHFASKDALTGAMIERFVERFDLAWADAIAADPVVPGRHTRAYITATHDSAPLTGRRFDQVNGAITASLANTPERLEVVRAQGARHHEAIRQDAMDPVLATIIRLAVDGMWFTESFGLMQYDAGLKAAVIERLRQWTRATAPEDDLEKANKTGR